MRHDRQASKRYLNENTPATERSRAKFRRCRRIELNRKHRSR